jgi:hypothetical protein
MGISYGLHYFSPEGEVRLAQISGNGRICLVCHGDRRRRWSKPPLDVKWAVYEIFFEKINEGQVYSEHSIAQGVADRLNGLTDERNL